MCFRLVLHSLQFDWLTNNRITQTQEYLDFAVTLNGIVIMMVLKCGL